MTVTELEHIITKGEGLNVEFKKATNELPLNLFETVCAFLNCEGGHIILGVNDDKEVLGVNPNKAEQLSKQVAILSNHNQKLNPPILLQATVIAYKNKTIIYIFVPASSQVHSTKGKIFNLNGDGDYLLTSNEQISQLYLKKSTTFSESTIYPDLNETHFVDGIVEKAMQYIRNNRPNHPWLALTKQSFFKVAGLYRTDIKTGEQGFTQAALLLFGKEELIQSALPHYKIEALLRSDDIDRYDDRETIRCNLIDAYSILMAFVSKHLPDKFYLEGDKRISLREKIFRELIANLLMHREYSNAEPATFIIYKNQIIIKNANRPLFNQLLTPGQFEPFSKNPSIANFFVQMALAEDLGTGINKVFDYLKAYANTIPTFNEGSTFTAELPLKKITKDVPKDVPKEERLKNILIAIKQKPGITMNELAILCHVNLKTIKRDMQILRSKNLIVGVGSRKEGFWKILNI